MAVVGLPDVHGLVEGRTGPPWDPGTWAWVFPLPSVPPALSVSLGKTEQPRNTPPPPQSNPGVGAVPGAGVWLMPPPVSLCQRVKLIDSTSPCLVLNELCAFPLPPSLLNLHFYDPDMLEMKRRHILLYIPIDLYACHLLGGPGWGEVRRCMPPPPGSGLPWRIVSWSHVLGGREAGESEPPLVPSPCLLLWDSVDFSASLFCSPPISLLPAFYTLSGSAWASLWVMWGGLIHG